VDRVKILCLSVVRDLLKVLILLIFLLYFMGCAAGPVRMSEGPEISTGDEWGYVLRNAREVLCGDGLYRGSHFFAWHMNGDDLILSVLRYSGEQAEVEGSDHPLNEARRILKAIGGAK